MRIINWNVNGVRATSGKLKNGEKKGTATNNVIKTLIEEQKPDVLCFQEVKTQNEADLSLFKENFKHIYTNFAKEKKGYSGVSLMCNIEPEWVSYDFNLYTEEQIGSYNMFKFVNEGRIITAKFKSIVIVTTYVPNSKAELARLDERLEWETIMRNYLKMLETELECPVVLGGDLNVAPTEMDIYDTKGKHKLAGFTPQERAEFQKLLKSGFVDSYRHLKSEERKYTYWSNFANSRQKNNGWRIDFMLVSESAKDTIVEADCLTEYLSSDHCPILLEITV
jgi:exodeoxyribonuclease-3